MEPTDGEPKQIIPTNKAEAFFGPMTTRRFLGRSAALLVGGMASIEALAACGSETPKKEIAPMSDLDLLYKEVSTVVTSLSNLESNFSNTFFTDPDTQQKKSILEAMPNRDFDLRGKVDDGILDLMTSYQPNSSNNAGVLYPSYYIVTEKASHEMYHWLGIMYKSKQPGFVPAADWQHNVIDKFNLGLEYNKQVPEDAEDVGKDAWQLAISYLKKTGNFNGVDLESILMPPEGLAYYMLKVSGFHGNFGYMETSDAPGFDDLTDPSYATIKKEMNDRYNNGRPQTLAPLLSVSAMAGDTKDSTDPTGRLKTLGAILVPVPADQLKLLADKYKFPTDLSPHHMYASVLLALFENGYDNRDLNSNTAKNMNALTKMGLVDEGDLTKFGLYTDLQRMDTLIKAEKASS